MINMKQFLSLFAIVAVALVFVTTGCKEDDTDPINFPADVILLQEDPTDGSLYFYEDFEVNDTATFVALGINAEKGTGALKSLTITQDGSNVDVDRLQMRDLRTGATITVNNPLLITGDNVDGFDFEILLNVHNEYGTTANYSFNVGDENDLVGSASINITTTEPLTPLDMTIPGALLNAAGPAGTGGLDLDTGDSTGSGDAAAEIRDLGIDCAEPNSSNWLGQIGTVNGADMKKVDPASIENFDFDTVDNKEIIEEAYSKGTELADGSTVNTSGCDAVPLSVTDVDAPAVGDVYVVSANGTYYMFEIVAINVTTDNNDDEYEVNIKF